MHLICAIRTVFFTPVFPAIWSSVVDCRRLTTCVSEKLGFETNHPISYLVSWGGAAAQLHQVCSLKHTICDLTLRAKYWHQSSRLDINSIVQLLRLTKCVPENTYIELSQLVELVSWRYPTNCWYPTNCGIGLSEKSKKWVQTSCTWSSGVWFNWLT